MRDGHRRLLRLPQHDRMVYRILWWWWCWWILVNVPVRTHVGILLLEVVEATTCAITQCHRPSQIIPTATRRRRSLHHHRFDRPLDFLQVVSTTSTGSSPGNHHHRIIRNDDHVISSEKVQQSSSNIFWPPWPFNLLQPPGDRMDHPPTVLDRLRRVTTQSTRVAIRTTQELGAQLWCHAPPVLPPLILYALWPSQSVTRAAEHAVTSTTTMVPLWSNAWVRNSVGVTLTVAVMSWAHAALHRQRCPLTPLPLLYPDHWNRAELPPFLPDAVATWHDPTRPTVTEEDGEAGSSADVTGENRDKDKLSTNDDDQGILARGSPRRWRRYVRQFRSGVTTPKRSRLGDWQRQRQIHRAERTNAHRLAIYDELLVWQQQQQQTTTTRPNQRPASSLSWNHRNFIHRWNPWRKLKHRSDRSALMNGSHDHDHHNSTRLGYALVTGASQGIGRAISVELARWQVPLILVARDLPALVALATDLEACYGIDCTVLSADLSRPNASEQIYQTVTKAGLKVDILVNNAGISSHGETLNMPLSDIQRMIQVNTVAVTSLTHLFGRDMMERRRGRILLVSSICGAVNGIATVAVYAATKAYENSLGAALGKELEPYGIGVTSLMPGAVRGTDFRSRSNSQEALCWKLPFYAKSAPSVAASGVRALLRGDTEVTPGVLNRLFLKVLKPVLPQRLHNLLAEIMWNPVQLPFQSRYSKQRSPSTMNMESNSSIADAIYELRPSVMVRSQQFWSTPPLPRILCIEEPVLEPQNETIEPTEGQWEDSKNTATLEDTDENVTKNQIELDNASEQKPIMTRPGTNQREKSADNIAMPPEPNPLAPPRPPTSELDRLLDQYKRHRSISIDDPWSSNESIGGGLLLLLDGQPEAAQRTFLVSLIDESADLKSEAADMLWSWAKGDQKAIAISFDDELKLSPELMETLLRKRNANWSAWIAKRLEKPGTIMVAVGAGHLAGEDSVQAMLAQRGLKAKRVQ